MRFGLKRIPWGKCAFPTTRFTARKRRGRKNIAEGVVHIHSTFNNTIVTISDYQGNVISWSSAGAMGFKGSRKGTPFAAQQAADSAAKKAMDHGLRSVQIFVRGPGAGRESALRELTSHPGGWKFGNGQCTRYMSR